MNHKVRLYKRKNTIWLDFYISGRRYRLSTGLPTSKEGYKAARGIASNIESDLIFQRLTDERLNSYLGKKPIENVTKSKNLTQLWDEFVERQRERMEPTTFKNNFRTSRNAFNFLLSQRINHENSSEIKDALLRKYALGTVQRIATDLIAFGNWSVDANHREINPYVKLKKLLPSLPKSKRAKKAYSEEEATAITEAFRSNAFMRGNKNGCFKDSHYGDFVEFLFTVGCRPEDAIALHHR